MKILLNCLPPADINTPSMALSVLKSFMKRSEVETEIKYWNFDLSLMSDHTDSEDPEKSLLPFLSILNDKENNSDGNVKILKLMEELKPSSQNRSLDILEEKKTVIQDFIKSEIQNIDFSEISLFGISAKYYQWIPGLILAEEVKRVSPKTKIVVGGFGSVDAAEQAMLLCPYFDFTTWGEGEYPLLDLYKQLESGLEDFSNVPRLLYKVDGDVVQSTILKSKYLDFSDYPFSDFDDFMDAYPFSEDEDEDINFPINTIRSCNWRKCKFCDFNSGYKLRSRTPQNIVSEIEFIIEEYGITTFSFVDSDTFGNRQHFEELLDKLIKLKYQSEEDLIFWAEIIPNPEIDSTIMKKMSIAGFKNLFIGYDGLSDKLLEKMDKRNSFADNIFFVKESLKNAISSIVNVIRYIPDETEEDVLECINNLKYLRFFYNMPVVKFEHIYVDLVLSSTAKYYEILSSEDRKNYDVDDLSRLMPSRFSDGDDRFKLFRYRHSSPANSAVWEKLEQEEMHFKESRYSYTLLENDGIYYYTEYCNDTEIENIIFGEPEYGIIIGQLQSKVYSIDSLLDDVLLVLPEISIERLKEVLSNLKESYLVYFDDNFQRIVTVID